MENKMRAMDAVSCELIRGRGQEESAKVMGVYDVEHYRGGELIGKYSFPNMVVKEGRRYLLDAALCNSAGDGVTSYAEQTAWYVMMVSGAAVSPSDTMVYDTFSGTDVTEFSDYSGGVRPTWSGALQVGAAQVTNSAGASFAITGSGTLRGAALVSLSTIGDSTAGDYLFSYSLFGSSISVVNGDTVKVTITITLS